MPASFGEYVFAYTASNFTVFFTSSNSGFTSPTWNGYPCSPYAYDYTLTYDGNGSTEGTTPPEGYYKANETVTASMNIGSLAKNGNFIFAGWNTQSDGQGTSYEAGTGTFTITSDTVLYAKWVYSVAPGSVFNIHMAEAGAEALFKKPKVALIISGGKAVKVTVLNGAKEFKSGVTYLECLCPKVSPGTYTLSVNGATITNNFVVMQPEANWISSKYGSSGDAILLEGTFFGSACPKVYMTYKDISGNPKKAACKVHKPYAFAGARGKGQSVMDIDNGESELTFDVTNKIATAGLESIIHLDFKLASPITIPFNVLPGSNKIAFIYSSDIENANSFTALLTANGFVADIIPLDGLATADISTYDVFIAGVDTSWSPGQALLLLSSMKPVLGLGSGGTKLFFQMGVFSGMDEGASTNYNSITAFNQYDPIFYRPYAIEISAEGNIVLYENSNELIAKYAPAPLRNVQLYGCLTGDNSYFPIIGEKRKYILWGFSGGPDLMTGTGRKLFINVLTRLTNNLTCTQE